LTAKVITLNIQPGIQRDGTLFDSPKYVDGLWVRFQRGRPRKIGGYSGLFLNATGISRGILMQSINGINYVYSGQSDGVYAWQTNNTNGVGSGPTTISMSGAFSSNANNLWQWDVVYDSGGSGQLQILGHPSQNLNDISSTVNSPVMTGTLPYGAMTKMGIFTASTVLNSTTTATVTPANLLIGIGQSVSGTGITAGTTVSAVSTAGGVTTITLSATATSTSTQTLTYDNNISVSGGVCVLYPYTFVYGNNGLIQNNSAGNLQNWVGADANSNNVSGTKVIKGMPLRGGTTSPAGLFWSTDQLTRVTYAPQAVGSSTVYWRYDIISTQTSIMSSQCVIEYDGIFYWAGVDRFLMYNGVVQEIPNDCNMNFFFDNLNYAQRQKVWVTKVPRWGEIWWFYPSGTSTECNNAIIYNVREKIWYDAGFAIGANRSAGIFSEVFRFPIWADNVQNTEGKYTLWQHENGVDEVYLTDVNAIQSHFETNSLGWVGGGPGNPQLQGDNVWIRLERVEPDFVQNGDMNLYIKGKGYAEDQDVTSQLSPYVFSPDTLKIDMKEQYREMRIRFESNTYNGNYEMGRILISADVGDIRGTGNP
jgi:hypothetical protein